jgi:Zn-dependent M28 family amino/carboxypeptidase
MPLRSLPILLAACVVALAAAASVRGASSDRPEGRRWLAHVRYLARDSMRGRQTGSPEHAKAAQYVAAQFKELGLAPGAPDGSYLQPVAFAVRRVRESECSLDLVFGDRVEHLELGKDATLSMSIDQADSLDAPMVFAGYGISVPEQGYDDFATADLKGKVVVYIQGGPATVTEPRRSQAQFSGERWARMREKGAIGLIAIRKPGGGEGGWERGAAQRFNPGMSLAEPDVDEGQGKRLALNVNVAHAQKWFEGSGHRFDDLMALADSSATLPVFPLAARVRAKVRYDRQVVTSHNVIARLPGRDPKLKGEYVVLTGHLDHLGVGAPVEGDSIFNGALDNASGVGQLIEIARALAPAAKRPARSLLFVIVTGEEKGLLGSYYFTRRPSVPMTSIAANVNVDMVLPIVPLEHMVIHGVDESTLGDLARAEAKASGIEVLPDPAPKRNLFIRSDQFNFIRAGVPALAFSVAAVKGSPQDSVLMAWQRERYHEPSDDLAQPLDLEASADLIRYATRLTAAVANAPARPGWKESSFFRRYAGLP